ncbi:MAG: DNA mismatch repair endonuclease MutL [Gammaproteobacteria bacterium]|nr:DNA mismatch repair endonuclease MutL [Gammaproteobacteria bacterium]
MPIQILPPQLANQIAAGEVVERPASVLKELLENSLDAGARRIVIELERGGVGLIRLRDDGSGVPKGELALALTRHATSKIRDFTDLEAIASLGFRGEALASISAVSELSISSNVVGQGAGWQARASGRDMTVSLQPCAHPVGTTVEVRELFGHVPARRRFLKSEQTELAHGEEMVRRIALARPDVHIELSHNGRRLRQYRADSPPARLAQACGQEFAQGARSFEREIDGLRLWGWLTGPDFHRASSELQFFFVNGRAVRDRVVSHALRQGYEGLLPEGRHAGFVLYFELDPGAVDVNVHPTKHEVRFRDARRVHDFLAQGIAQALAETTRPAKGALLDPEPGEAVDTQTGEVREARGRYTAEPAPGAVATPAYRLEDWPRHGLKPGLHPVARASAGFAPPRQPVAVASAAKAERPTGLVQGQFLLADTPQGLWLLRAGELQALRLRVRFTELLEQGPVPGRPLLLPVRIKLAEAEAECLNVRAADWQALGFAWLLQADQTLILRQQPSLLPPLDWAGLLPILLAGEGPLLERMLVQLPPGADVGAPDATELQALARQGMARCLSATELAELLA